MATACPVGPMPQGMRSVYMCVSLYPGPAWSKTVASEASEAYVELARDLPVTGGGTVFVRTTAPGDGGQAATEQVGRRRW